MSYMNETPPPAYAEASPPPQRVSVKMPAVKPTLTYVIIGATTLVYVLQMLSKAVLNVDYPAYLGMKINEAILAGQLWRLMTPMLLHGSIMHIGFNMYALYVIGAGMESRMGHARFLLLYLVSGFAGNVFSFFFTDANSLGASTAIFGLLAAEGVFLYLNKELFGQRARKALSNIVMVAVVNLMIGLSPGIDNWGHVGGLIGGLIFAFIGGPRWEVEGIYPLMQLVDRRDTNHAISAAGIVVVIFSGVAILKFIGIS